MTGAVITMICDTSAGTRILESRQVSARVQRFDEFSLARDADPLGPPRRIEALAGARGSGPSFRILKECL